MRNRAGGGHPSRPAVADRLERSTRRLGRAALERLRGQGDPVLFDLAPGGVYRAVPVTRDAGGLLHHRFTLTAHVLERTLAAVCFLWHFPASHLGLPLATTLPCGARTFLGARLRERRDRPVGTITRNSFFMPPSCRRQSVDSF